MCFGAEPPPRLTWAEFTGPDRRVTCKRETAVVAVSTMGFPLFKGRGSGATLPAHSMQMQCSEVEPSLPLLRASQVRSPAPSLPQARFSRATKRLEQSLHCQCARIHPAQKKKGLLGREDGQKTRTRGTLRIPKAVSHKPCSRQLVEIQVDVALRCRGR